LAQIGEDENGQTRRLERRERLGDDHDTVMFEPTG